MSSKWVPLYWLCVAALVAGGIYAIARGDLGNGALALLAAVGTVSIIRSWQGEHDQRDEIFLKTAASLQGLYDADRHTLDLTLGGATVCVDTRVADSYEGSIVLVVAKAKYMIGCGPVFRYGFGLGNSGVVKSLDVTSRPHAQRFAVLGIKGTCEDPEATQRCLLGLSREFSQACQDTQDGIWLSSDGESVIVAIAGLTESSCRSVAEMCAALARGDDKAVGAILALPDAQQVQLAGPLCVEMMLPQRVAVGVKPIAGVPLTCAWTEESGVAGEPFLAAITDNQLDRTATDVLVPNKALGMLGASGASALAYDGKRLELRWDSLETDSNRLLAGAKTLASFGEDVGPYR